MDNGQEINVNNENLFKIELCMYNHVNEKKIYQSLKKERNGLILFN